MITEDMGLGIRHLLSITVNLMNVQVVGGAEWVV